MAETILPGYVTTIGNKYLVIDDHAGPVSYTTGGETVTAAQFGLGGIDFIDGCNDVVQGTAQINNVSFSGVNFVAIKLPTTTGPGVANTKITLQWFVVATGAEVAATTNLSGQTVRLRIVGV